jgi:TM2 domain-containing membrane protein YozV/predicted Ser/Thr protein kinase
METNKICPNCRKLLPPDVPLGLCPECLIKSGFPTGTEPGATGEAAGMRFVPPPVEEIARLFPQLEILGLIGKGGMGAVYKARQPALDRFVALKVLPPAVASDPGFAERFNREARALARLNHPNIVAVHDFGKAGPLHYLLMEFVDGTNLREVEQAGRLSPEQALAIVPQICEALQFAHNEGIVHRDIKPENLLLDKKGRVKITDFGIAKIVGVPAGKVSLTGIKDVVGTPHYMAPEQIEKPLTVDHRADIYSLGVVFYEMLTGELPLGKFAPPSKKVQIDVRLDEVVLHTLEKEPSRRYQQASQLKTDVETIAAGAAKSEVRSPKSEVGQTPVTAGQATSDKILLPTFLLAFFFGPFGAHRFYVGKTGTAILQLCTFGACGIWAVIDWILILCKVFTDGQGRRITNWLHPKTGELQTAVSSVTGPPSTPPPGETAASAFTGANPPPTASPAFASTPPGKQPGTVPQAGTIPPAVLTGGPVAFSRGKVTAPAVGLMVAAALKLSSALSVLFLFASPIRGILDTVFSSLGINSLLPWQTMIGLSTVLFKMVPALFMLFGAIKMVQLRSYAWAIAAAILAIVCCSLVGFPVGIWALVVLSRQDVREAFACQPVPQSALARNWPWLFGTAALGVIFLVVLALGLTGGKPNVTVTGIVTDAVTGNPIAGARVDDNRYGAGTHKTPQQTWTDTNGDYELKTRYEEHTIAASAPGYETKLNTLVTEMFGFEREMRMDFQLQPARANAPVTNGGSGMALNISSQNGQVVIETTNGRLSADKVQLQTNPKGSLTLTGPKMDYVVTPTPPTPPTSPVPPVSANATMPSQPTTAGTLSEPRVHRTKIIGNLVTTDEFQQDFSQTLPLTTGGRLSLDNVNGRIEIVGWDRNEVAIKALKHGKTRESVEAAKITINASPDEVFIHTEQPSSVTGFPWSWLWFKNSKRNDGIVDYAIQVPQNARLKNISSVNGRIVIEDVSGDIEASTVNGETQVQGAAGDLKLSTVNGRIEAELASLKGSQSVSLSTVNGHIEVALPVNANGEVTASTVNGGMSSEFPSLAVKKEFPLGRNLKGTLGSGGASVKASTVNGGISFRQGTEAK